MKTTKSFVAASFALILLTACGSTGMGDILGGGTNQQSNYEIRGTVESIDLNSRSIYLTNVSGYTSMLSNGGNSVRVYYDDRTPVEFNGQSYRPSDLERGDQVAVRVDESGNNLKAESVTVLRDVSSGSGSTSPSGSYESTIRGTVRNVDTARRTIELESTNWISGFNTGAGSSTRTIISYDTNLGVTVNGRTESVSGLERGDIVEVQVTRDANNSTLWAQRLVLVRDVNSR